MIVFYPKYSDTTQSNITTVSSLPALIKTAICPFQPLVRSIYFSRNILVTSHFYVKITPHIAPSNSKQSFAYRVALFDRNSQVQRKELIMKPFYCGSLKKNMNQEWGIVKKSKSSCFVSHLDYTYMAWREPFCQRMQQRSFPCSNGWILSL